MGKEEKTILVNKVVKSQIKNTDMVALSDAKTMIGCSCYNNYPLDGSVTNAKVITGEFTTRDAQQVFYGEDAKEVEVQKVQVKQEDIFINTMKVLFDQQKKEIDEKVTFQV